MADIPHDALYTLIEKDPEQAPDLVGALTSLVQFAEEGDPRSLERAKWFIDRAIESAR